MDETASETKAGIPPAHSSTPIRSKRWLAATLAGLLGVGIFVGTAGAILYDDLNSKVKSSVVDTSHLKTPEPAQSEEEPEEEEVPVDSFAGRPVNILVMGSDARVNQSEAIVAAEDDDESMRSDTTLVVHIPADRESLTVVSIPRDIWMKLPECQRSDGSISYSQWGQFNWAFSYGSGGTTEDVAGALNCTEQTVEEMTGLKLDAYALFDFDGFGAMVDALGGVNICLEEELTDNNYLHMTFEEGCQVMDAVTATQYARVRHVGDGSDMGRIQRQQGLIGAMMMQAMNSNILTDMPSLYQFVTATLATTILSPSLGNVNTDVGLANSIKGVEPENIRFTTMPVLTTDFNRNRLMPKEPLNSELWESIKLDLPLPEGVVYQDMSGEYFTIGPDGESIPGGNPRTDDEIGKFTGWIPNG